MTQRQRLITKYIAGLELPILTKYQLFFLTIEKEAESRRMLLENLVSISTNSTNVSIEKIAKDIMTNPNASIVFGLHDKSKDKKEKEPKPIIDTNRDHVQTAYQQLDNLNLEDSLKSFQLSIQENRNFPSRRLEKFYKDRSIINMALGNYNESLSLSMKGRHFVMSFVSAICKCEFDLAETLIKPVINMLCKSHPLLVISSYELTVFSILICFATMNSKETFELTRDLITNYQIHEFNSLYNHFCKRNYIEFLKEIPSLKPLFANSLYLSSIEKQLTFAIIENVISQFIFPLAKVDIVKVSKDADIPQETIVECIRNNIRKNKLFGKLDLVDYQYIASLKTDNERYEMEEYLERVRILHRKSSMIDWQRNYISCFESQQEKS